MQIKLDRIISIATLAALIVAIVLVLKKPAPMAQPQAPAGVATSAQSSNAGSISHKEDEPEPAAKQTQPAPQSQAAGGFFAAPQAAQNPPAPPSPKTEARSNSDAIGAAVSQLLGAANGGAGGAAALTPDSDVGSETPNIKDQKVDYDGDLVHGHFLTEIAGKDVWVTISGHLGQKDGYATFEPTEFKVGDMEVPVSLVNPALQRKLAEERDRLKMSDPAGAK
jgi:hypothetical protein